MASARVGSPVFAFPRVSRGCWSRLRDGAAGAGVCALLVLGCGPSADEPAESRARAADAAGSTPGGSPGDPTHTTPGAGAAGAPAVVPVDAGGTAGAAEPSRHTGGVSHAAFGGHAGSGETATATGGRRVVEATGGTTVSAGGDSAAGAPTGGPAGAPSNGGSATGSDTGGATGTGGATSTAGAAGADSTEGTGGGTTVPGAYTRVIEARFNDELDQFQLWGPDPRFASGVGGCEKSLSLLAPDTPDDAWAYQASRLLPTPIKTGDVLYLQFWARSPDLRPLGVVWELATDPYTKQYDKVWPLNVGWTLYQVRWTSTSDFDINTTALRLRVGYGMGVYEIACLTIDNYGPHPDLSELPETDMTWGGYQWDRAAFKEEADERIRTYRKANYAITVRDAGGHAVPSAVVRVQQTKQKFVFGTAVRSSMYTTNPTYASMVPQYFNQVTVENDLKWLEWEKESARAAGLAAIALAKSQGLKVKGHNLVWAENYPARLDDLDAAGILDEVRAHIQDELTTLGTDVYDWDVVNEPCYLPALIDRVGNDRQLLRDSFTWAREFAPFGTDLFVNEYTLYEPGAPGLDVADPEYDLMKWMVDTGVDFDGIGLEGHMYAPFATPVWLWDRLDRFGALGKRVQITELDVREKDINVQADVLDILMRTFYAHPAVDGITLWGFWSGAHWRGYDAALFGFDFTPKPSGDAFTSLVRGEWWTDELCQTNSAGQCSIEAFLGNHSVSVTKGTASGSADASVNEAGTTVPVPVVVE